MPVYVPESPIFITNVIPVPGDSPVFTDDNSPVPASADDISACLHALEAKQLISVDDNIPIAGYDYSAYHGFSIHGSMALTAFGQDILDSLIYQNSTTGLSV